MTKLSGWGNNPKVEVETEMPSSEFEVYAQHQELKNYIARGAGRSYGDAALSSSVMLTSRLNETTNFDENEGVYVCRAGKLLFDVLNEIVPRGYFLPVTPGTKYVSVGGAIAADIHGKNHHVDGCFSEYLNWFKLMTADGQVMMCSKTKNSDLFWATCGGMGLTGVLLEASFRLIRIETSKVINRTIKCFSLAETIEQILINEESKYSVAWVDCVAVSKGFGRSLLYLGEHASSVDLTEEELSSYRFTSPKASLPFNTPSLLLNNLTLKAFNALRFFVVREKDSTELVDLDDYFYPLDKLDNWNRLYGSSGLVQYQVVIPLGNAQDGISRLFELIASSKVRPFLAVLKLFGKAGEGWLSFPKRGLQVALDFKRTKDSMALMNQLDELVLKFGGRAYLAKDTRMKKPFFEAGYPKLPEFKRLLNKIDTTRKFNSLQSVRLGIT